MKFKEVTERKEKLESDLKKITKVNKEELSTNLILSAEKKEVEAFLNSLDSRIKTLEVKKNKKKGVLRKAQIQLERAKSTKK